MNVYLESGDMISADRILRWVNRSDLTPIPRTLEMTVRSEDGLEGALKEGDRIQTGREMYWYKIVKTERDHPVGYIQHGAGIQSMKVTALLDSCASISYRQKKATVANSPAYIRTLYRMCGADVKFHPDYNPLVGPFACFYGDVPSFAFVRLWQEYFRTLVLREGTFYLYPIPELLGQEPKQVMSEDTTELTSSEFMQRQEIPSYFSVDPYGEFVKGDYSRVRASLYSPRKEIGTLRLMTQVLVTRRIINSKLAEQIQAGDLIVCGGIKQIVITAAHGFEREEGSVDSWTRLWCGEIQNVRPD